MPGFVPVGQVSYSSSTPRANTTMANSPRTTGFSFRKRWERVDWKRLACVDVDRIARELDFQSLQENIMNVTFCNIENELDPHSENANFIKLFKLAQLCIEYLLHSQEYLTANLEGMEEKLQLAFKAVEDSKQEVDKKKEAYNQQKKEIRKLKKWIAEYQIMMRAGASGLHKCVICAKTFVSNEYLTGHLQRRHHGEVWSNGNAGAGQSVGPSAESKMMIEDLQEIKDRLRATEAQLENERRERQGNKNKDNQIDHEKMDKIQKQYENWKREEESRHMEEMADFKRSFLQELRDVQDQKSEMEKTLYELRQSMMMNKRSMIGNLQDDDEIDSARNKQEIENMKEMFQTELQSFQEKTKHDLEKLDQKWRRKEQKLQQQHDQEITKSKGLLDQYSAAFQNEQKEKEAISSHYEEKISSIMQKFSQHEKMLEDQKAHMSQMEQNNTTAKLKAQVQELIDSQALPKPAERPPAPQPIISTKTPLKSSLKSPSSTLKDEDIEAVTFYVSNNGNQNYRLWKTSSSASKEWTDLFSFSAHTSELGDFDFPLYVYSAGGSPYWRQYVSDDSHQPVSGYRLDYTLYVSKTPQQGTQLFYVLDGGSGPVIKSCVSKAPSLPGWKEKGLSFYAYKTSGLQKSVTLKSTETVTDEESESEDYSTPVTGESVESFNRLAEDKVDAAPQGTMTDTGTLGMSSEWGTTTLETRTFIPFQRNPTITTHYNHKPEVVQGCRQEIEEILEQSLAKRGLQPGVKRLSTKQLEAKMDLLKTERMAMSKKRKNFFEIRQRKAEEIDDLAEQKYSNQKSMSIGEAGSSRSKPPTMRSAGAAIKAANVINNRASRQTPQSLVSSAGSVSVTSQSMTATSVTERTVSVTEEDDDDISVTDESEESEWDASQEKQPSPSPRTPSVKVTVPTQKSPMTYEDDDDDDDDDFDSDLENELKNISQGTGSSRAPQGGEKVRNLAASLESSLGNRGGIKKPAGAVDVMGSSSPKKQQQATPKAVYDDDSDFDISSDEGDTRAGPKGTSFTQAKPTPAPRHNTPSPPRTTTNTAITRFNLDDLSDFDDDDLDIENIT